MKKTLLLTACICFSLNGYAQDKKLAEDCFKKEITNVLKNNTPNWQKKSKSRNFSQNIMTISEPLREDRESCACF
jgi:hypothetical protein